MKGKQTSDIEFNGYDHTDAFMLNEWETPTYYGVPAHYQTKGSSYYANAIWICDDEEVIDPTQEETKDQINKFEIPWRKVFDDSWLEDSHYWMFLDNDYYNYAESTREFAGYIFPYYKSYDKMDSPISFANSYASVSFANKVIIGINDQSIGSSFFNGDTYYDRIDGKIYRFEHRVGVLWFSQNGIDWYPYLIENTFFNSNRVYYYWYKIASEGVYICFVNSDGGFDADGFSIIYVPYTLNNDGSVTVSGHREINNKKIFNVLGDDVFYLYNSFTLGKYIFVLKIIDHYDGLNNRIGSSLVIYRIDPDGNVDTMTSNRHYNIGIIKSYIVTKNNKAYFSYYYTNTDSRDEANKFVLAYIGEDGVIHTAFQEDYIYEYVGGYYYARQYYDKRATVLDSNCIMYDEKTDYYYLYARVTYDSKAFPKQPTSSYYRTIIGKTRDFVTFYYSEPEPCIIKNIPNHNKKLAICFDERKLQELQDDPDYLLADFINSLEFRYEIDQNLTNWCPRICFNNERLSHPNGIINPVHYANISKQNGIVYYLANFDLTESNKDFVYNIKALNDQGTWSEVIYQSLINQLYGLDYPGKE